MSFRRYDFRLSECRDKEASVTFTRYAIYYAPDADAPWAKWSTAWLGWDMGASTEVKHPSIPELDIAAITQTPRKYGLHATIKPPMYLAKGTSVDQLDTACAALAKRLSPVTQDGLKLVRLGRFLALRPIGDESNLAALAAACVRELDIFRAPATPEDLQRRRATELSETQEANLINWGYPYVMDQFRFHITLTGKLDKPTLAATETALMQHLAPLLPKPFEIKALVLAGQADDGRFHLIKRYDLAM